MLHINYFTVILKGGVLFVVVWLWVFWRRMMLRVRDLDTEALRYYVGIHACMVGWFISNLVSDNHKLSIMIVAGFLLGLAGAIQVRSQFKSLQVNLSMNSKVM